MVEHTFKKYDGDLAHQPGVHVHQGDGRSYLARQDGRYDLIWFVAPDSYAAMNAATSGAYVLSESYLYTREMILESLAHLGENGLICAQFGEVDFDARPNRTARYLATARDAFRLLGMDDFRPHVLVATTRGLLTTSTIILRRAPFTDADVQRFVLAEGTLRYAPGRGNPDHPITQVISLPDEELERWHAHSRFDVRPVTDDSPIQEYSIGLAPGDVSVLASLFDPRRVVVWCPACIVDGRPRPTELERVSF